MLVVQRTFFDELKRISCIFMDMIVLKSPEYEKVVFRNRYENLYFDSSDQIRVLVNMFLFCRKYPR